MKRLLCIILTVALIFSFVTTAEAKNHGYDKYSGKNTCEKKEQKYKLHESPFINYGRYKLPLNPVTKGMGAAVTYDNKTAVLTVVKGNVTIVIQFKNKTVAVNGVPDKNSGIFTARNSRKMTVLIYYIAKILGISCIVDDDDVIISVPGLNQPTNVTVTPVGSAAAANTLNAASIYLTAAAKITPGQAAGGRAELYVGTRLIAVDTAISAADDSVGFTTSDGTPTNAELQALIPAGGVVSVKLYNASGSSVTSSAGNPTLNVDYAAPTVSSIISASYNAAGGQLSIAVTGAGAVGDLVDVTQLMIVDYSRGKSYRLTNNSCNGSSGSVQSSSNLVIKLGTADKCALSGYNGSPVYLSVGPGSLLKDAAGNTSPHISTAQIIPVTGFTTAVPPQTLNAPANVTVSPIGTAVVANTLNSTTLYMDAYATITAGQATGGRAELYVGSRLVAADTYISATDTTVNFTTTDGTPTNAELQADIPSGGAVTVKLYNAYNTSATSSAANPTLIVDYTAPTISGITSAVYDVPNGQIYLLVTGAGAVGDTVDVTRISLYDSYTGKSYQLTDYTGVATTGTVIGTDSIVIKLGAWDKSGLTGYGNSAVFLTISAGSLLRDAAGNTSPANPSYQSIPVTLIK